MFRFMLVGFRWLPAQQGLAGPVGWRTAHGATDRLLVLPCAERGATAGRRAAVSRKQAV